jgi:glycosyltransferase involved in cell wall biosynthesis
MYACVPSHHEFGKRLFWFDNADDGTLEGLYRSASILLAASDGEGFGLPLIEAASHGLPIIARDLRVFREVAGDHAFYFAGRDAPALAAAISDWLDLYRQGKHPSSVGIRWLTWDESAGQLKHVLFENQWLMKWEPRVSSCLPTIDTSKPF